MEKINIKTLRNIVDHNKKISVKNRIKGLAYERCAELPFIIDRLKPLFKKKLNYLDIGSGGESPLPTYFLKNTNWNITVIDKYKWVRKQNHFADKIYPSREKNRFKVVEQDFTKANFEINSYDIITNISVIEHFEKDSDLTAMQNSAKLLKPRGIYLLTTPVNEGFYKEIYVNNDVYGVSSKKKQVFYQRHYDLQTIQERIIIPSGLKEVSKKFFGDYKIQFFEDKWNWPKLLKPFKIFFVHGLPNKAYKYLSYSDAPISCKNMKTNTASGIILELTK